MRLQNEPRRKQSKRSKMILTEHPNSAMMRTTGETVIVISTPAGTIQTFPIQVIEGPDLSEFSACYTEIPEAAPVGHCPDAFGITFDLPELDPGKMKPCPLPTPGGRGRYPRTGVLCG